MVPGSIGEEEVSCSPLVTTTGALVGWKGLARGLLIVQLLSTLECGVLSMSMKTHEQNETR